MRSVAEAIEFFAAALTAISDELGLSLPYDTHREMSDLDVDELIRRLQVARDLKGDRGRCIDCVARPPQSRRAGDRRPVERTAGASGLRQRAVDSIPQSRRTDGCWPISPRVPGAGRSFYRTRGRRCAHQAHERSSAGRLTELLSGRRQHRVRRRRRSARRCCGEYQDRSDPGRRSAGDDSGCGQPCMVAGRPPPCLHSSAARWQWHRAHDCGDRWIGRAPDPRGRQPVSVSEESRVVARLNTVAVVRGSGGIAGEIWLVPAAGGAPRPAIRSEQEAVFSDYPTFTTDGRGILHDPTAAGRPISGRLPPRANCPFS